MEEKNIYYLTLVALKSLMRSVEVTFRCIFFKCCAKYFVFKGHKGHPRESLV